jgi:ABC-type polysaccharide/polyol phosphate export permease
MGLKLILDVRFKPWLNAPENTYESIVAIIFKIFSKRKIQLQFTQESQESVPSLYFGLRYKFLSSLAGALTAGVVFFKRSTSGTKYGFFLVFLPVNSVGLYYLLFIQFSSNFNYGLQLHEQLFLVANWTLLEIVTLKVALSLKYEKGLIQSGKLRPLEVEMGAGLFGLFLSLPLIIFSLIAAIGKVASQGIFVLIELLILVILNFWLGLFFGIVLSRITSKRDLKFIIPIFFKVLFLFSPMFNRITDSPGFFTYLSEISIFNLSFKLANVGYSTGYLPLYLLLLTYLAQVFLGIFIFAAMSRKVHLVTPSFRAVWFER